MDDSDDYFFDDDFVLDESSLAVLDREEQKFQTTVGTQQNAQPKPPPTSSASSSVSTAQRRAAPRGAPLPPAKKQKVSHGAGHTSAAARYPQGDDYDEDLPDIAIVEDGTYGLSGAHTQAIATRLAPARSVSSSVSGSVRGERVPNPPHPQAPPVPAPVIVPVAGPSRPRQPSFAPASRVPPAAASGPVQRSSSATSATASSALSGSSQSQAVSSTEDREASRAARLAKIQLALQDPPARNQRANTPPSSKAPPRPQGRPAAPPPKRFSPAPRGTGASSPVARPAPSGSPSISQQAGQGGRHQSNAVPPRLRAATPPSVLPQLPPQQPQHHHAPPARQQTQQRPQAATQSDRALKLELETLKAQFEDLLRNQKETEKALEEAQNVRYAKEGEVSILRKSMEKTVKDHAAEVARFKAAKEQAEVAQAQVKKEMDAAIERMKTQFLFKQHELESAGRKTPWSVRIKRTEGPLTPVSASQRRFGGANGYSDELSTPSRSRQQRGPPDSPQREHRKKVVHIPESPPKKQPRMAGFVNAFEPTTPKPSGKIGDSGGARFASSQQSQLSQGKGKGKERVGVVFDFNEPQQEDLFFNPPSEASQPPLPKPNLSRDDDPDDSFMIEQGSSSPGPALNTGLDMSNAPKSEDIEMQDEVKHVEPTEPIRPLWEVDWVQELNQIVLTHKHRTAAELTLQLLMHDGMFSSASPERAQEYSTRSSTFLQCLGSKISMAEDEVIRTVGEALSAMGRILCSVRSLAPLTALLDMMKILGLYIPTLIPLAVKPTGAPGSADAPPEMLLLLCDTVRNLLTPDDIEEHRGEEWDALADETLGLLEAICWNTPPELSMRLSVFVRKEGVLSGLINPAQPTWLLRRTMRVLTLIASYPSLPKQFLLFPVPDMANAAPEDKNYSKIPQIEALAALLTNRKREPAEARPLKLAILNFVTTLAVANKDSLIMLLQSQTLLHSIISFLRDISDPLWEEDEEVYASNELIAWTIDAMLRVVVLLHYLILGAEYPVSTIRHKLFQPQRRRFNGVRHMFFVTLGRIGYASPPDAISAEHKQRMDQMADVAKDVFEFVVDGPELESTWAAFHVDEHAPGPSRASRAAGRGDESEGQSDSEPG